jgi:TRAP-type C4-dicarboxylate transport system permease small subunit
MKAIFAMIDRIVEILVATIFAGMVLVGFFQVFSRFSWQFRSPIGEACTSPLKRYGVSTRSE